MTNKETELACLGIINALADVARALEGIAHEVQKIHLTAVYPDLKLVENEVERALAKDLDDKGE